MQTNWKLVAEKVGTLNADGSERCLPYHSNEALEEILGEEFIHHSVDTFIKGDKGNELAIKTIRSLRSRKAAEYAYTIFQQNKNGDAQKARYAIWAMDDILHPLCMQYASEFLEDERYIMQATWLIKELVYNCHHDFTAAELDAIFIKAANAVSGSNKEEVTTLINQLKEFLRKEQHFTMPKYYVLAINKIAVTNTQPAFEYEEVIVALDSETLPEAETLFEKYKATQNHEYKNEAGETVTIRFHKLVQINSFLFDVPHKGFAEIFSRHFNDYEAYCKFDVLLNGATNEKA